MGPVERYQDLMEKQIADGFQNSFKQIQSPSLEVEKPQVEA